MTKTKDKRQKRPDKIRRRRAPGRSVESIENKLTLMAYSLAEERMRSKVATAQEILHFIKEGSVSGQLEKKKLESENVLLEAKAEALKSQKRVEELYAKAMKAYRTYSGQEELQDDSD